MFRCVSLGVVMLCVMLCGVDGCCVVLGLDRLWCVVLCSVACYCVVA